MRLIVINWKWLPISPIEEDDEPSGSLLGTSHLGEIAIANSEDRLIQLNLHREEAEFEDEYEELYDERNELLKSILGEFDPTAEILLFLHKNAPHHYGLYDLEWFAQHLPQAQVELFGGGEDFLYDLHNNVSGLLDQVGNFSLQALEGERILKQDFFNGIWAHYKGGTAHLSGTEDSTYTFFRELLEDLLPIFKLNEPDSQTKEKTKTFLEGQYEQGNLPSEITTALEQIIAGKLPELEVLRGYLLQQR